MVFWCTSKLRMSAFYSLIILVQEGKVEGLGHFPEATVSIILKYHSFMWEFINFFKAYSIFDFSGARREV